MKHFEIERRFVLYPCSMKRFLRNNSISSTSTLIIQFYLVAKEGEVVRYRRRDNTYIRTVKHGSGLVREEDEETITKDAFEEALARNRGGVIKKRRFVFKMDGFTFELDSFKRPLKGLNILEIEFGSESEAKSFVLPDVFKKILAEEVTDNISFTNGAISKTMRIPPIERALSELLNEAAGRKEFLKASVNVRFGPYESGAHALKVILYSLVKSVEANRSAILNGSKDPERLHQLRVAMRKIRALFSQMSALFDPIWCQKHKDSVSSLMRKTGEMRDIDVYLEEIREYGKILPEKLHPALEKLEKYLHTKEAGEREKLHRFLADEIFREEMEELAGFAANPSEEGLCADAYSPVILPVKAVLYSRYRKILKKGGRIDKHSPAHEYHAVRIDVKKLRYLMEFFSSIFDEEAYKQMAARLKSIQTILGKHQDLDVQSRHLKSFEQLPGMHDETTLEAFRFLRKQMDELQLQKRTEFRREFAGFSQTQKIFKKMICKF